MASYLVTFIIILRRLTLLRVATEQELSDHGDVCSICYMEMENPSAVITDCQHFFHKGCLKKWLVVQDNCPLCTKPIVKSEEEKGERVAADAEEEGVTDFESEESSFGVLVDVTSPLAASTWIQSACSSMVCRTST